MTTSVRDAPPVPDPAAARPAASDPTPPDPAASDPAAADPGPDGRSVVVELVPGPDGPLAILTMLRGRRYDVVDVRVERRGARMTVSVALPPSRMPVLLERLRRIPVVLAAHAA